MQPDQKGFWKVLVGADTLVDYTDVCDREPNTGGPTIIDPGGYGAPDVSWLNLARRNIERVFVMTREHNSNADATSWFEVDGLVFARVDDVTITHMDTTGAETSWVIKGAKVQISIKKPINVATETRIIISGGAAVIQA